MRKRGHFTRHRSPVLPLQNEDATGRIPSGGDQDKTLRLYAGNRVVTSWLIPGRCRMTTGPELERGSHPSKASVGGNCSPLKVRSGPRAVRAPSSLEFPGAAGEEGGPGLWGLEGWPRSGLCSPSRSTQGADLQDGALRKQVRGKPRVSNAFPRDGRL